MPSNKEVFARLIVLKGVIVHAMTTPRPELAELYSKWSETERNEFEQRSQEQAQDMKNNLKNLGLWKYVSPKEIKFLQSYALNMDQQQHMNAIWRKECAIVLMWALGLRETWPIVDEEATPEMVKAIPIQKIGLFSKQPNLRPKKEIAAKRDLIQAWHWRARTRRMIEEGHPFPQSEEMERAGFRSFDDIVRFSAKAHYQDGDLAEIIDEDFVFGGKAFRTLTTDEFQIARSIISERHFAMNWLCGMSPGNLWDETPTDT